MNESKIYQVTKGCAQWKQIPIYFVATILAESPKAYYVYGHGTTEVAKMGVCMMCGRELTHPVSVELGIGPECGKHYWDWNIVGGYSIANVKRLTHLIQQDIKVDCWIPKGLVTNIFPSTETISIPSDHPMVKQKETPKVVQRTAEVFTNRGETYIKVKFPYNVDDLSNIKPINGRRFNADDKSWTIPLSQENVEKLKGWKFSLDSTLENYQTTKLNVQDMKEISIPGLNGQLFPFQSKGVSFIEQRNGRALIADEMGLGKTVQAIAWLQLHKEKRPAVIVVPSSLKLNWKREIENWMFPVPKVQILSGTSLSPITGQIVIINYDILHAWATWLSDQNPQVLIIDEVHYTKSSKAQRTKAVQALAKGIPHVIALSGTPIVNRPIEAFNAIKLIDPLVVPNFWNYAHKYCNARNNGFGWDFSGASNQDELHRILTNSLMIRRKKSDVLKDLPDKIRSWTPIELDNQKEYDRAETNFIQFVREKKGESAAAKASNAEALAEIEGLKQLAIQGKMKAVLNWIEDFLEVDGILVVMAVHRFVIDTIVEHFPKICVKVDGSVSITDRQTAVDRFQNDPTVRLFVGNIKAAGVGLTLTAASNVAFVELPWTPGDLTQAEDRCHRIGQKQTVNIHYLLAAGTIEEKIARLLDRKRKVLDAVLDGKETEEESLLMELLKEY